MTTEFAVTWDYRCPFARNFHEHLIAAVDGGADWDVTYVPFSLNQMHTAEGEPAVWDDPEKAGTLLAPQAALVVRDRFPEAFPRVHVALFAARHDEARDIREEGVIRAVLEDHGVDADSVFAEISDGGPLKAFRAAHDAAHQDHGVFGVPTVILGDRAVFVRIMDRPSGDAERGRQAVQGVLDLLEGSPELNEYKFTRIPR